MSGLPVQNNETLTPNRWVIDELDKIPTSYRWMIELDGISGSYFKYEDINLTRWLYLISDLNHVHPYLVKDYTLDFTYSGQIQSQLILDLLITGTVQPIQNGFVFFKKIGGGYYTVFVAVTDERLADIKVTRTIIVNRKHDGESEVPFEYILKTLKMDLLPDYA
jgi:hypothetical protein